MGKKAITLILFVLYIFFTVSISYTETVSSRSGTDPGVRNRLVEEALSYVGSYYRYAGTSREGGFDCSGLVYRVYLDIIGVRFPRMVPDMYNTGQPIAKSELLPGDLVFFNTLGYVSHVGMYIGNGKFVHAENEKTGVIVTSLSRNYYVRTYVGARRHIKDAVTKPADTVTAAGNKSGTEAAAAQNTEVDPFSYFHGYFDSTFGPMTLMVMDSYGNTKGQYKTSSGTGELWGKIDLTKMAFVGKWSLTNNKGSVGGDVYFYLNPSRTGLEGYWRYTGERKWIENWDAVKR